ncbi:MAG TPA: energy transducer TonB [Bacteroidia bacterium]
MNLTIKTTNNMTEMLFEKRNKDYGAYNIRTTYNDSLLKSLIVVSAILLLVVGSSYAYNNFFVEKPLLEENATGVTEQILPIDLSNPIEKPKVEKVKSFFHEKTQAMATIINDNADPKIDPDAKTGAITTPETKGDTTDRELLVVNGDPKGTLIEDKPIVEDEIIIVAEEMPEYPGGTEALLAFLSKNIVYPSKAVAMGVEGTVYVNFVVNKEGKVDNIKILKGIGGDCNEEAMRVVAKMPKWKPGKNAGKEVRVAFNLPIRFTLK